MSEQLPVSEQLPPKMGSPNVSTMVDFQKMVFIYNAVNDGWAVKLLDDGRYEFRKKDIRFTSDECLDGYLKDFIRFYMKLKSGKGQKATEKTKKEVNKNWVKLASILTIPSLSLVQKHLFLDVSTH